MKYIYRSGSSRFLSKIGSGIRKIATLIESDKPKIKVTVDKEDTWDLSHMLSPVIVEGLKAFKKVTIGMPVRVQNDFEKEIEEFDGEDIDYWKHLIDKMIWAFEQSVLDEFEAPEDIRKDREKEHIWLTEHFDKIEEGRILFAKYFTHLWW